MADKPNMEIIREAERRRLTGISRIQWWRYEKEGTAPIKLRLGPNTVGWLRHEIEAWVQARVDARAPGATELQSIRAAGARP